MEGLLGTLKMKMLMFFFPNLGMVKSRHLIVTTNLVTSLRAAFDANPSIRIHAPMHKALKSV